MQLKGRDENSPLSYDEFSLTLDEVLTDKPKKIAVAVSGGGDSLALTLLTYEWCIKNNVNMTALTVDHGLRSESVEEAKQVNNWLTSLGINHQILTWIGHKPDANIQDEARNARYRLMGEWCVSNDIEYLFLGHHQDDQAETFLMRLFRGSGIDGLSAMEKRASFPYPEYAEFGLQICRPLLSVPKKRLLSFLKDKDQTWVEDPSNEKKKFLRIQIRELIKNSEIDGLDAERLSSTAQRMQRVRSLLDELTDKAESVCVVYNPLGFAQLNVKKLSNHHEEIALRLLARILKKVSGEYYPPRFHKLERLYENIQSNQFSGQTLLGTNVFQTQENEIFIVRETNAIDGTREVVKEEKILWDKRFIINTEEYRGTVKILSTEQLDCLIAETPDFKDKVNDYFNNAVLRDRIMPSLPCIVTKDRDILLPSILLQLLGLRNLSGFSMVFKE